MKVFILEDDPARMMFLRERLINHTITHVESCEQFDQFQPPYDLILLDHDLGGRQLEDHEDDGSHFAEMMHESGKLTGHEGLVFHSYNPDGARAMQRSLGYGIIAPFRGPTFCNYVDAVLKDSRSCYEPGRA